jgi:adenine-specific DNA-methyltransferase
LKSYEDALNNIEFSEAGEREMEDAQAKPLAHEYKLRYMLNAEARGSASFLNIEALADPATYTLRVKKAGSDEYDTRTVDLLETFNYLLGLRVDHVALPQSFTATFKRERGRGTPRGPKYSADHRWAH